MEAALNEPQLRALLSKCKKRKGRETTIGELPNNSLVIIPRDKSKFVRHFCRNGNQFTVEDAANSMYQRTVRVTYSYPLDANQNEAAVILTKEGEKFAPEFEPALKTTIERHDDGSITCTNFVCGMMGQTFSFVDEESFLAYREEHGDNRVWLD